MYLSDDMTEAELRDAAYDQREVTAASRNARLLAEVVTPGSVAAIDAAIAACDNAVISAITGGPAHLAAYRAREALYAARRYAEEGM